MNTILLLSNLDSPIDTSLYLPATKKGKYINLKSPLNIQLNNVGLRKIVNNEYNTVSIGLTNENLVNNIIVPLEDFLQNNPQINDTNTYDFRSILDDRYPKSVIIKLKINCKNTYQNSELLCGDVEVIGEDLHKVMNDCTVLTSVSYFELSRKWGINLLKTRTIVIQI